MFKKIIATLSLLFVCCFSLKAQEESTDRITATQDDNGYFNTIEEICEAANAEDHNKYLSLRVSSTKREKREIALFFLSNKINISILDKKLIDIKDDFVEIAVEYKMTVNETNNIIVSLLAMKKIDSDWKLIKETVISKKLESRCRSGNCRAVDNDFSNPPRLNCPNGKCRAVGDSPLSLPPKPNCANGRCNLLMRIE